LKILLTGHKGYIGSVLAPMLQADAHDVVGLDSFLFDGCDFGDARPELPALRLDIRDVEREHLVGFEAVIHLAALSNDPLGDLDEALTYDINHLASVRLARLAKEAGVERYLFASSCSLYGAASPDAYLTESAAFNPVTAYGVSKVRVEQDVARLADDSFSPTFLRNATAYGLSPMLRGDLVINNLVGLAYTSGEILIRSDGTPWRPLVHVEDIARAFLTMLRVSRERVHNQAFNVGQTEENYQVRDLAEMVRQVVPGSTVAYAVGAGPDLRCYRVDFGKIRRQLPEFQPRWTVPQGINQLYEAFRDQGVTLAEIEGPRYLRIRRIGDLLADGRLDGSLRWRAVQGVGV
jgi:nucleoside-diphosphate-sugar epimerase